MNPRSYPQRLVQVFSRKPAFSLVEVLVGIVVLAVLVALIVPFYSGFRFKSGLMACTNNQRAIGVASNLYASDHNGQYPPFWSGGSMSSSGSQKSLAAYLVPPKGNYLEDQRIFRCPLAMDRIYLENKNTGWVDWIYTNQNDRSGYWHIYISPFSTYNPQRAQEWGRNDNIRVDPRKVLMHDYYHPTNTEMSAHADGSVNVLRVDGSVQLYRLGEYDPRKSFVNNFGWDKDADP